MTRNSLFSYRSMLFIPSTERFLTKIQGVSADAVIVDLEDSIPENQKQEALQRLHEYLKQNSVDNDIFVRINRSSAIKEISLLDGKNIKGYVIPKVEQVTDIIELVPTIKDKMVVALIESPMGSINLKEIAACPNIHALAFGAEDFRSYYSRDIGEYGLIYTKSKLTTLAKAYNKPAFDSVSLEYKDTETLEMEVETSLSYGFTGKLAIHPNQVDTINNVFEQNDYKYYEYVVQQYDTAKKGVLVLNGRVYEKPHIEMYRRRLERRER